MYRMEIIMLALEKYSHYLANGELYSLSEFAMLIERNGGSREIASAIRYVDAVPA